MAGIFFGMIHRALAVVLIVAFMGNAVGWAAEPNARTHRFQVEYLRAVRGLDADSVNVTFYDKIDLNDAAKFVRKSLELCVDLHQPTGDVLASGFNADGDALNSKEVSYIYVAKKKFITSYANYLKTQPQN